MKQAARMLCGGILVLASTGCVPSAPSVTEALQPARRMTGPYSLLSCGRQDFLGKALYISNTVVHPAPGSDPPMQGDTFPAAPDYLGDLGKAWDAASDKFRERLCGLDVIYVQNASCSNSADCFGLSWGWQQKQKITTANGRLVSLSTSLWSGPQTYTQYETDLLQSVLPTTAAYSCPASGSCSNIDNVATRLLAVLAHEIGHIRWNDPTLIDPAHPRKFCNNTFFNRHWQPAHQQPRWRYLGAVKQ